MTKQEQQQQTFLGMPMSWQFDLRRIARNVWNPADDRVFLPKVFGIGWDVNGHALLRRLGLLPSRPAETKKGVTGDGGRD